MTSSYGPASSWLSSSWRRAAALVCLILAPLAQLVQYLVTPLGPADSAATQVSSTAAHLDAMRLALVLDVPILLILPAVLYAGLVGRSRLAMAGAAVAFASMLGAGYLLAMDIVVYEAARQPDRAAATALVSAFEGNGVQSAIVLFFLIGHVVGFALLGAGLIRSRAVPVWAGAAVGAWPIVEMAGQALGVRPITAAGDALLLIGFAACAFVLVKPSVPVILSGVGERISA